jgi:hypothetical protein
LDLKFVRTPGVKISGQGIGCWTVELILILNPSASHFAMGKSLLREEEVVIGLDRNCLTVFTYYANLLGNEAGRMIYDGDIIIVANKGNYFLSKQPTDL